MTTAIDYRDVFELFRRRPGLYIAPVTFAAASAFLAGVDAMTGHQMLNGFQPWLGDKVRAGRNLAWPGLVLWLVEPFGNKGGTIAPDMDAAAVGALFELVDEFLRDGQRP